MILHRAIMMTAGLLGIACSPADDATTAAWHGSVELRDSAWMVSNPDAPVFDSSDVRLAPEWSVELLPDSAVSWAAPGHVRILHGLVYVLDLPAHRVAAFDTLGRRVLAFGQEGAGPGEMKAPTDLLVLGNAIGVDDGRLGRAIFFDESGNYLRAIPIPQMSLLLGVGDSEMVIKYPHDGAPEWRLIRGGTTTDIGPLSVRAAPFASRGAGCWADAGGGVIVVARCTQPSLLLFSPSMRLRRVVTISRAEQNATPEQMDRLRQFIEARLSSMPAKPDVRAGIVERRSEMTQFVRTLPASRWTRWGA